MVYLQHHGVKGMKWGVRRYQNKDGSLTEAGKKRLAKQVVRERNRYPRWASDIVRNSEVVRLIKNKEQVASARTSLVTEREKFQKAHKAYEKKASKLEDEFYGNDDLIFQYKVKAYNKLCEKYPSHKGEKLSKDNVWLMYEDWDQENESSFVLFCKDRGIVYPDYTPVQEARNKYIDACKTATNELLGKYGSMSVTEFSGAKTNVESFIASNMAFVTACIDDNY